MGEFKPLLKLGSCTALEHAVRCFFRAGVRDVRVVAGYRAETVAEAVKLLGVRVVINQYFDKGMYSSVQAGVRTLEPEVRAFFLLPADYPLVRKSTVEKMLECFHTGSKGIVYPVFQGRRGHPPLISARYAGDIINSFPAGGLRELLGKYEHDALDVPVSDETVLLDMDTPEDYEVLLQYLKSRAVPTLEECRSILRECRVSELVWKHSHRVAGLALLMLKHLKKAGAALDEDLVLAGALLHDVARSQPDHAGAGARLLEARGYPLVAKVVAAHMDIDSSEDMPLSEPEVVFLADKMIKDQSMIPIPERFAVMLEMYKDDRQACEAVLRRLKQALLIKRKVEKLLGRPLESVCRAKTGI